MAVARVWDADNGVWQVVGGAGAQVVADAIEMGGDTENAWVASGGTTGVYQDGISLTFVKPSTWTTYKINVVGGAGIKATLPAGGSTYCRLVIDGNNGEQVLITGDTGSSGSWGPHTHTVRHERTGLNANAVLKVQWMGIGPDGSGFNGQKQYSWLQYIAVRLT